MDKEKLANKVDETGHKIDDWVEDTATKHSFSKWKVWAALVVGVVFLGLLITTITK